MLEKVAEQNLVALCEQIFSVILNSSLAMMQTEFYRTRYCFHSDNPEALIYLTDK